MSHGVGGEKSQLGTRRGVPAALKFLCPPVSRQKEAEAVLGPCSMQQHFIVPNHLPFPFRPQSPTFFSSCPQGGTEELEASSQCTLPAVPLEGLHSPPGSSWP